MEKVTFQKVSGGLIRGGEAAVAGAAGTVILGRPFELIAAAIIDGARNLGPNVTSFPEVVAGAAIIGAAGGIALEVRRARREGLVKV